MRSSTRVIHETVITCDLCGQHDTADDRNSFTAPYPEGWHQYGAVFAPRGLPEVLLDVCGVCQSLPIYKLEGKVQEKIEEAEIEAAEFNALPDAAKNQIVGDVRSAVRANQTM
jgi:hypothetical protein